MKFFRHQILFLLFFLCSSLLANESSLDIGLSNSIHIENQDELQGLHQTLQALEDYNVLDYSYLYQCVMSDDLSDFENILKAFFNDQTLILNSRLQELSIDEFDMSQFFKTSNVSIESLYFLMRGTVLNDFLLYQEAIEVLTDSIKKSHSNRDAFIERARAYFETDQLELALKDYKEAKRLSYTPPFLPIRSQGMQESMLSVYVPEQKITFSKGLLVGVLEGGSTSTKEFIPSILSSCRGILNGLWAFVLAPRHISEEMIFAAYDIGEYISSHSMLECIECVIPEIRELSLVWNKVDDYTKGQKIGYIIGKYGLDILAPIGVAKGVAKFHALKRANTMCTLEACTLSQENRIKILQVSAERAALRESIISESVKKGKILAKTANVQYHIMQPKHAWDKVVKLSGNVQEDFKKVITFLEEKNIMNSKNLRNTIALPKDAPVKNINLLEYKSSIDGQEIQVFFEKYLDTGEIFIKNGFVITKPI